VIGDQQLLESRIAVHGFWLQHVLQGTVNKLLYTGFRKHDDPVPSSSAADGSENGYARRAPTKFNLEITISCIGRT